MSFGSIDPSRIKTWPSVAAAVVSAIVIITTMIYFTPDFNKAILFVIIIGALVVVIIILFKTYFLGPLSIMAKMKSNVKTLDELRKSQEEVLGHITDPVEKKKTEHTIDVLKKRANSLRDRYGL